MNHPPKSSLLADQLALLVRFYGLKRVESALARIARSSFEIENNAKPQQSNRSVKSNSSGGTYALESIRRIDPEKYRLLNEFLFHLRDRSVLPASQDILYFAQLVGLKEIAGKSRETLVTKLMRFLIERPIEQLRTEIESAANISQQQRNMGFSVLTDKLIGSGELRPR